MFDIFIASVSVAYVLLIWFHTNAFYEYCRLLHLRWFINDYEKTLEHTGWNYVEFLKEFHQYSFLVRLVTCPICLSVWLSLVVALLLGITSYFLVIGFLSLVCYHSMIKLFYTNA